MDTTTRTGSALRQRMSMQEVAALIAAARNIKHQTALSVGSAGQRCVPAQG